MNILLLVYFVSKPVITLSSFILPGTGEIMLGEKRKGEVFLWSGIFTTSLWLGFNWYGNIKKEDALSYASMYANANPERKDEEYLIAVEYYRSAEDYNEDIAREAREKYPNDYAKQQEYIKKHGYFGDDFWCWSDSEKWDEYIKIRDLEREAFQRAELWFGFALLTRFASMIDCLVFTEKPVEIKTGFDGRKIDVGFVLKFK